MPKHKLIELQGIIEELVGSLREKVEIDTNMKPVNPNPYYLNSAEWNC
jgi:hypothetical protein